MTMSDASKNPETRIALFQRKEVRRTIHNNEWWFVVEDVVLALIESRDPKQYIQRMKQRDPELGKGWVQIVHTLSIPTDGGPQPMLCANTEGLFRLIQSIPSPKAEPFKRWLAKVGYERIQEIEDPELATKRTRALYKAKGYSEDWIEKRMRSIAIRDELTDEWKKRGVREQREYAILTAEISKATFGLTPGQYAEFKRLKRENLRDHMTDLELIFSMLGEASTTEIARNRDSQGFPQNKKSTREGGTVAGNARRELERKSGRKVVTSENYLSLGQPTKEGQPFPSKAAIKPRVKKP
jgi:DNA-damage-inducible protein D